MTSTAVHYNPYDVDMRSMNRTARDARSRATEVIAYAGAGNETAT